MPKQNNTYPPPHTHTHLTGMKEQQPFLYYTVSKEGKQSRFYRNALKHHPYLDSSWKERITTTPRNKALSARSRFLSSVDSTPLPNIRYYPARYTIVGSDILHLA